MTKKEQREREARISRVYGRACSELQLDVMRIGDVFRAGGRAIDAGADDAQLGAELRAAVLAIMGPQVST